MIFLAVGNVVFASGTSDADAIRGLLRRMPASAILLIVGLFAVTGSPPFGMFISEFTILSAAIGEHHPLVAASLSLLLAIIFVGIAAIIFNNGLRRANCRLPRRRAQRGSQVARRRPRGSCDARRPDSGFIARADRCVD